MVIESFQQFGAKQSEVGALRKLLNHHGMMAPHSGKPFSEELLFGVGGGIGFAYFLFEKTGTHPIYLGTRVHTKETERPEFLQVVASRLGISIHVQNSSSANAAASNLRSNFEQGRTPIVWLDASRLPYMGLNATMQSHHAAVVYGWDEGAGRILISDRCPQPVSLTLEEFRIARESSWSPKYRAMIVQKSERLNDVRAAVEEGIRDTIQQMTEGLGITNFGLKGLDKWATVLTSSREKKSWLKIFPPGPGLFDSLLSIFSQIRLRGEGGSAYRSLYADFLDEAAELLGRPALRSVADHYRLSEQMWTELADAHLPASVPQFEEIRRLSLERKELFETRGPGAVDEIQQRRQRIEDLSSEMRAQFPLPVEDSKMLLNELRLKIQRLREHEAECIQALNSAIGGGGEITMAVGSTRPVEVPQPAPVEQPQPLAAAQPQAAEEAEAVEPQHQEPELANH